MDIGIDTTNICLSNYPEGIRRVFIVNGDFKRNPLKFRIKKDSWRNENVLQFLRFFHLSLTSSNRFSVLLLWPSCAFSLTMLKLGKKRYWRRLTPINFPFIMEAP